MAPIQRRRFVDTSENQPQDDQPELGLENATAESTPSKEIEATETKSEGLEPSMSENSQSMSESPATENTPESSTTSKERVFVRRPVRRTAPKFNGDGEHPPRGGRSYGDSDHYNRGRASSGEGEYTPRGRGRNNNFRPSYGRGASAGGYERNLQMHADLEAAQAAAMAEDPNAESKPRLSINDLTSMSMPGLRDLANQYGLSNDDLAPM